MDRFGAGLKQAREARKLSLEDVSLATKIGVRFLKALEEEDFAKLPGGVFNKSFTRAYARELGLNEEEAVAGYLKASGGETVPEPNLEELAAARQREREIRHRPGAGFSQLPWGFISIALVVAAIALAVWGSRNRENVESAPARKPNEAGRVSSTPVAQPSITAAATPAGSPSPEATMASATANATPVDQPTTAAANGMFEVRVKAREDAWISITADGQQIMQDILTAQTEKSIEARSQVTIRTGNVGALDFSFAGKKLPVQGDFGEVRTLTFDSNGLQPSLRKTALSN
jgi:cytoskeleton protein RodZ